MQENTKAKFENLSFYILTIVTFLVPLFFVPVSFISIQFGTSLLFATGVILAFISYVISIFLSGSLSVPQRAKYVWGFVALVPIIYILAGIGNGFSRMTFFGYSFDQSTVGFIVLAFIYLLLLSSVVKNKKRVFYSYLAFFASSLLFALFLVGRLLFGVKFLAFGLFSDITSTMMGSWNGVGIFFGMTALLSMISLGMIHVSKVMKILLSVSLVLSLFFLALINFSIVWAIVGISAFLFVVYTLFSTHVSLEGSVLSLTKKLSKVILPLVIALVSLFFVFWGSTAGGYLANTFKTNSVDVRPSFSITLDIIRSTIQNHPLFGSGPNTFVTQWLSYKPDDVTGTVFWNTDFAYGIGLLPTFAVTTGLFGILSWLLFFGLFLFVGVKAIFAKIEDVFEKFLLVSSFFISLYLWIIAAIYVPSTTVFILTFFFTGLFFATVHITGIIPTQSLHLRENPRVGFVSSLVILALSVGLISLGVGLFKNSQSLWYFQKSSYAMNTSKDVGASETLMKKAISIVPLDIYYRSLSEIETVKLASIVNQDQSKIKPEVLQAQVKETLSDAIGAGISSRDGDPANYQNWVSLGRVYQSVVPLKVQGAYESAQFAYNEAFRRNPKIPGIFLLLAQLEVDHGDLPKAEGYALQAIQAKQNYLDAYFLLAQIEIAGKNLQGAVDSVAAATVLSPSDPSIFFQLGYLKFSGQDFKGAIEALEKSLSLSPQYANAKYYLGLSYEAIGNHTKAIVQFQDLKQSNPESKEVDQILSALLAGKPIFQQAAAQTKKPGTALPVKEKQ